MAAIKDNFAVTVSREIHYIVPGLLGDLSWSFKKPEVCESQNTSTPYRALSSVQPAGLLPKRALFL